VQASYIGHLEITDSLNVIRPYHLHDFLEKVSDLLVEVKAIEAPLRQVRPEFGALRKKRSKRAAPTPCSPPGLLFLPEEEIANTNARKARPPSPDQ